MAVDKVNRLPIVAAYILEINDIGPVAPEKLFG